MVNSGLQLPPSRASRSSKTPFPGITLLFVLVLLAGRGHAQQDYFVLIQSDNNQPFYARIGAKTYSSSTQGHLIIPQLKDSSYRLLIGFPRKLFPEQEFPLLVHKKDLEFRLKNLGEKGWGLFNPQTLELKTAIVQETGEPKLRMEGVKKDDAFSRLMAGVVSDTAVMYAMEPQKDSVKGDTNRAYTVDPVEKVRVVASVNKFDPSVQTTPPDSTGIQKFSEHKTAKSLRLVYMDRVRGRKTDTIQVIIPFSTGDSGGPAPRGPSELTTPSSAGTATAPRLAVAKPDCKNAASDYDIDKLRLRMLSANRLEDKIGEARAIFITKCFTTKQVRALSEVFVAEGAKFRFLEAASPYISDDQFGELSALFSDPAYIRKFKTLAGG